MVGPYTEEKGKKCTCTLDSAHVSSQNEAYTPRSIGSRMSTVDVGYDLQSHLSPMASVSSCTEM